MSHFCRGTLRDRSPWSWPENTAAPSQPKSPSHQEIAALAYSYWEARGKQGGSPLEDWARAESELRRRSGPPVRG